MMVENFNRNAYFALKLAEGGYASVDGIEGFSLCGGQPFTLSAQFFAEQAEDRNIMLVRQDETFEFGVNNRAVYFKAEGLGEIILPQEGSYLISENVWNTVAVTFDKEALTIYVNGIKCLDKRAGAEPKTSTAYYEIAKNLDGYLRYVKLFNRCFSNEEVIANLFDVNAQTDETELFLDFSLTEPEDKGKYGRQIILNNINIKDEVLQVENDGTAELRNSDKLNEIFARESFTVIFNIYPLPIDNIGHDGRGMMIFSNEPTMEQENFSFIIKGFQSEESPDILNISAGNGAEDVVRCDIPMGSRSQVAIVYSNQSMSAYVNGERFDYRIYNMPQVKSNGIDLILSKREQTRYGFYNNAFSGYLNYFCVFDKGLTEQEIKGYYDNINSSTSNENLKSMYVCDGNEFIDIVDNSQAVLTGDAYVKTVSFNDSWCNPTSLVYSLDAGEKGCALVSDAEGLHNVLSTGSFSIYSKVFLDRQYGESALLSCADYIESSRKGMEILLNRTAESIAFNIKIDGMGYITDPVPINPEASWVDIAFIYYENEKKIRIFVMDNGQEMQKIVISNVADIEINTEITKIGNSIVLDRPFKGYIDYVAIFDCAISDEKIEKYPMNPPYIFEDGIKYLYCFNWKYPSEQVSQTAIELSDDATVATRIDTQNVLVAPPELYIPADTPSNRSQWKANIIFDFYATVCKELLGTDVKSGFITDPETGKAIASPEFVMFFDKYLSDKPEVNNFINSYQDIDEDLFIALLMLLFVGILAFQLALLCGVGGVGEITAACGMVGITVVEVAVGVAVVTAAVTAIFEAVKEIIKDREDIPDKDDDDDDDDDDSDYGRIQSVTFHTDRTGGAAVPIEGNTDTSNVLFISDKVNAEDAYIEVEYEYTGKKSREIRLKGNNLDGILGDLDEITRMVEDAGIYTFKFRLINNRMKTAVWGCFHNEINWIESEKLLKTTEYNVYLLAKMPVSPWNMEAPESSPTLESLKTMEQISKYCLMEKEHTLKSIAEAAVRWLQESGRFMASTERINRFSKRDGSVLYFNRAGFDIRVNDPTALEIEMSALDCSLVIADTARLNGFSELNVTELTTGFTVPVLEADPNQNPITVIQTGETRIPLDMRMLHKIGALVPQIEQDLTNHFIALTDGENITEQFAYDGYFREEGGKLFADRRFADMETSFVFSDNMTLYRESVFTKYTCCDIEEEYSSWVHGTVEAGEPAPDELEIIEDINEEDDNGYVGAFKIFIPQSARNFNTSIKNKFINREGKVICHSISYNEIKNAIITNVEDYFRNDRLQGRYINSMTYLTYALFCIEEDEGLDNLIGTFDNREINNTYNMIYANIEDIINKVNGVRDASTPRDRKLAMIALNGSCIYLCHAMNNVVYNLRLGDSSWNESAGDAFDPEEWCYVDKDLNVTSCYENILTYNAIPYGQYAGFYGKKAPSGEGFYLTNLNDGIRCNRMSEVYEGRGHKFFISRDQKDVNNITKHYIISSSNAGNLIRNNIKIAAPAKIYYYYGGGWQEI